MVRLATQAGSPSLALSAGPWHLVVRRVVLPLMLLVVFILVATAGYWFIEPKYTFLDAAFMAVITIATVGYGEVGGSLSDAGRMWSILVIIVGMILVAVAISGVVAVVVEGRLRDIVGRRHVEQKIARLAGHVIVCGYGRTGSMVAELLAEAGRDMVVIELDPERVAAAERAGLLCLAGDAQEEAALLAAGVERAEMLVAALSTDAENVFVTLSAREVSPRLRIVARAQQPSSEDKLRKAGAGRVICPQIIGASRMAQVVLRPAVVDFTDMAQMGGELEVEQIQLAAGSRLVDRSPRELQLPARAGVHVVAMQRGDGSKLYNPPADTKLAVGDVLILAGRRGTVSTLERLESDG